MTIKQTSEKLTQILTPNLFGSVCMAVVVHALLLLVLSIEMRWTRENTPITAEAELWSTLSLDTDVQQTKQGALRPDTTIPLDFSVLPPSQQVSPSVVEQEFDQSDNAKQLPLYQKEKKRRKNEASRLRLLEEQHQLSEESVRDPT